MANLTATHTNQTKNARFSEIKATAEKRGYATGAEIREMLDMMDLRQHDFDEQGDCVNSCFCREVI